LGGYVQVEAKAQTVSGFTCDDASKAEVEGVVAGSILLAAQGVRPDSFLVSQGSMCTTVPADPCTECEIRNRRSGTFQILAWATVAVPVADAADAAVIIAMADGLVPPSGPDFNWQTDPATFATLSAPGAPVCTYQPQLGYEPVDCSGTIAAGLCLMKCAPGFSLPETTPSTFLTPYCQNGGTFIFNGCYPDGCGIGGTNCTAATACCQYFTPGLSTEEQNAACTGKGKQSKVKKAKSVDEVAPAKNKKRGAKLSVPKLGEAVATTCAAIEYDLPTSGGKNNPKKVLNKKLALGVAVPVGATGLGALGYLSYRRRKQQRVTRPADQHVQVSTAAAVGPVTISV